MSGNAYLNYTQDYINQIAYLDHDILVMTYINGDMDLKTGIEHNIRWSALRWLGIDLGSNIFYTHSRADWHDTAIRNQGWNINTSATLNIMPLRGMTVQAQYFVTTPQYVPQFTTTTIHYCNVGIRQQLPKTSLTLSALVTDVFNTRRWDISSDIPFIPSPIPAATVAASSGSVSPGTSTPTSHLAARRNRRKTAASSGWENDEHKINP